MTFEKITLPAEVGCSSKRGTDFRGSKVSGRLGFAMIGGTLLTASEMGMAGGDDFATEAGVCNVGACVASAGAKGGIGKEGISIR